MGTLWVPHPLAAIYGTRCYLLSVTLRRRFQPHLAHPATADRYALKSVRSPAGRDSGPEALPQGWGRWDPLEIKDLEKICEGDGHRRTKMRKTSHTSENGIEAR